MTLTVGVTTLNETKTSFIFVGGDAEEDEFEKQMKPTDTVKLSKFLSKAGQVHDQHWHLWCFRHILTSCVNATTEYNLCRAEFRYV